MSQFPSPEEVEKAYLAWAALMDFGFEFALAAYARNYPDRDPLDVLREVWARQGDEHTRANEAMMNRRGNDQ